MKGRLRGCLLPLLIAWSSLWAWGCHRARETADDAPRPRLAAPGYRQAPRLAARVAAGRLPPVEERLPGNPLIVAPVERLGTYGGTWHMAMVASVDQPDFLMLVRTLGYENLVRWDPQWKSVLPNLAQSFEVDETATTFTFRLREGLRWSDGVPFTADDILFWYEDIAGHAGLEYEGIPWLTNDDDPAVIEKVDDQTIVFRFQTPQGLLLQHLAHPTSGRLTLFPRHYMSRFHPRYNPDGLEDLMAAAGVENWTELFRRRQWPHPDAPSLHAWQLTTLYHPGQTEEIVAERNPYYWKIDPAGRQLPYIDRVVFAIVRDVDEVVERILRGKVGMQSRYLGSPALQAPLEAHRRGGDYRFFDLIPSGSNRFALSLNLTHRDPVRREIFRNKDVRIGLSLAIDRQEIIEKAYDGGCVPYQVAPRPESPFYHERLARQYTLYDPKRANEHLDRAGYAARDGEGYRLGPDGRRISLTLDAAAVFHGFSAATQLLRGDWRAVGIDLRIRILDRSEFTRRVHGNLHDALVWGGSGGMDVILSPQHYFPYDLDSTFAVAWVRWYANRADREGEKPSAAARRQMALYDALRATAQPGRQAALMKEILDIAAEEFYVMGICQPVRNFGIAKNNFRNVPKVMPSGWTYPNPAPSNPSQYFIEGQDERK